jgi:Protein of unknown function (DUF3570)
MSCAKVHVAPPARKEAAVAATSAWRRLLGLLGGLVGSLMAAGGARAVSLPDDRAEGMLHLYDGGGVRAVGPALLVRKSLGDRASLSGSYYVDMVSNASIDVVTTASPYKEKRTAYDLGADFVVRDALVSIGAYQSKEPDYLASSANLDISQEVFGGMTTVALGYSRGSDKVGKRNTIGYFDEARHWQYRLGLTQILTSRWLASANFEAISDDGYLGNPYRAARVFGAAVPERNPRTRSSRAVKLRVVGDLGNRDAVRAEIRHYWDTWDIRANTAELGYSRYFGDLWLADALVRVNSQKRALFYSDNATSESLYVSRNRQLGSYDNLSLGAKLAYTAAKVPGRYEVKLNGSWEMVRFKYSDFTDVRSGKPYSFVGNIVQLYVSATY